MSGVVKRAVQRRAAWQVRYADDWARIEPVGQREEHLGKSPTQAMKRRNGRSLTGMLGPERMALTVSFAHLTVDLV